MVSPPSALRRLRRTDSSAERWRPLTNTIGTRERFSGERAPPRAHWAAPRGPMSGRAQARRFVRPRVPGFGARARQNCSRGGCAPHCKLNCIVPAWFADRARHLFRAPKSGRNLSCSSRGCTGHVSLQIFKRLDEFAVKGARSASWCGNRASASASVAGSLSRFLKSTSD